MADDTLARFLPVDEYGSGPGDREIGGAASQEAVRPRWRECEMHRDRAAPR